MGQLAVGSKQLAIGSGQLAIAVDNGLLK
ncbi:MAG: hypothetical protein K8R79_03130 [Calditrichales bacterium]|nr:hypothetical protein [Calditrichales bacterium]